MYVYLETFLLKFGVIPKMLLNGNFILLQYHWINYFLYTGVSELEIPPFDPFFAKEVVQKRGFPGLNYRLILRNVHERGWTQSEVTKFRQV